MANPSMAVAADDETEQEVTLLVVGDLGPEGASLADLAFPGASIGEVLEGVLQRCFGLGEKLGECLAAIGHPTTEFLLLLPLRQTGGKFLVEVAEVGSGISEGDGKGVEVSSAVAGLHHDGRKSEDLGSGRKVGTGHRGDGSFITPDARQVLVASPDSRAQQDVGHVGVVERAIDLGNEAPHLIWNGGQGK